MIETKFDIPKWIKKLYGFEEDEGSRFAFVDEHRLVAFVHRESYIITEMRKRWKYISITYQKFIDNFVFKNNYNFEYGYYYYLRLLIWLFDPKQAIIEICIDEENPMIISSPIYNMVFLMSPIESPSEKQLEQRNITQ